MYERKIICKVTQLPNRNAFCALWLYPKSFNFGMVFRNRVLIAEAKRCLPIEQTMKTRNDIGRVYLHEQIRALGAVC